MSFSRSPIDVTGYLTPVSLPPSSLTFIRPYLVGKPLEALAESAAASYFDSLDLSTVQKPAIALDILNGGRFYYMSAGWKSSTTTGDEVRFPTFFSCFALYSRCPSLSPSPSTYLSPNLWSEHVYPHTHNRSYPSRSFRPRGIRTMTASGAAEFGTRRIL